MSFFESLPRPPRPEPVAEPPRPAWMKPQFMVPGSVAADLVLLRTDEVAVTLGLLRAYTTGFEFTADVHSHARRLHHGGMPGRRAFQEAEAEGGLRLGLEFSDGRRAEIGTPRPYPDQVGPHTLVVVPAGSGGSDCSWHGRFWVYPLPPPGPLAFVATWPDYAVAEARVELEADLLLSAAGRAIALWPEAPDGAPLLEATTGATTVDDRGRGADEPHSEPHA